MIDSRPAMPARIRRSVLVEAGHRCAIPTCRHIEVDIHHIIPWETCKEHKYENLIALCPNCHRRADREEIDRKSLKIYKANLRYTHDKFSQLEVDILFELYRAQQGDVLQWPPFMMLLIKRLIDTKYIGIREERAGVYISGMKTNPDYIFITIDGRNYVDSLGIDQGN
jgi:HNH endonuclease